ncbi:MAG TPA: hypothetical protein VED46_06880 [Alphaproteobacteria bacterium]|nr:hypothetical protein [Alphaproteobacteria bacterium]
MTRAETCRSRWLISPLRLIGSAVLLVLSLSASLAEERPSPIAPYRYTSPPTGALDSLEQQKALSYRNELAAQRRLQQLDSTPQAGTAAQLRSQGDLNRETNRIDQMLQR